MVLPVMLRIVVLVHTCSESSDVALGFDDELGVPIEVPSRDKRSERC